MKKRLYGVLSVILAVVLISGTLAFTPAIQRAFNPNSIEGVEEVVWARLHNDYNALGPGEFNKDVYVENISDLQSIFVRVRIYEHLEFDGVSVVDGSEIEDFSTWTLFQTAEDDITQRVGDSLAIEENGVELVFGEAGDVKVFMPTFNRVHAPGDATSEVPDVFVPEYMHLTADAAGRGFINYPYSPLAPHPTWNPRDPRRQTSVGNDGEFGSNDGSHDYWILGGYAEGTMYRFCQINDDIIGVDATHYARANEVATADVMTIYNWFEGEPYRGDFWFFDVENGWFYWSSLLAPGEATAPLLCEIIFAPNATLFEKEYISEIVMEFFTVDELEYLPGDVQEVLYIPTSIIPEIGETFYDPETEVEWLVLAIEGGVALIITYDQVARSVYGASGTGQFRLFENSALRTVMNNWYQDENNVGDTLRSMALDYAFPEGSNGIEVDPYVDGTWLRTVFPSPVNHFLPLDTNMERARTLPGCLTTRGVGYDNKLFALSLSDVNQHEHAFTGHGFEFWTRSFTRRNNQLLPHSVAVVNLSMNTFFEAGSTGVLRGVRPAMWVTLY